MSVFGARLRELREHNGITQTDLANVLGVSANAVSMWERGLREANYETLDELADYFNVDANYLLGKESTTIRLLDDAQLRLISYFNKVNMSGRDAIIEHAEFIANNPKYLSRQQQRSE